MVRNDEDGRVMASALNPELMVTVPGRPELGPVAAHAKTRLQRALRARDDRHHGDPAARLGEERGAR